MLYRRQSSSASLSLVMALTQLLTFTVCLSALVGRGAPFAGDRKQQMEDMQEKLRRLREVPGFDPEEYKRYWDEMMKNDPGQMDRLKQLRNRHGLGDNLEEMMKNRPMFGDRMARGAEDIRSRLDEARRVNVEELRQLQRLQAMRDDKLMKDGDWMSMREAMRENLPPRFTNEDLQARLDKQQKILADLDKERHEEFRRYEMQMEHRRREKLKQMDQDHRAAAEKQYEEMQQRMREHEKLRHPASKEQLEDVWEHQDGLPGEAFDPKTFFHLHDKNGDKHLDALELEALFYSELEKVYKGRDRGGMEAKEDLARMREHAFTELDKNKDGMVSIDEFLGYTKSDEFDTEEEWKPVVDEDQFSEDELKKFEDNYDDDYYDYEYDDDGNIVGFKTRSKNTKSDKDGKDADVRENEQHPSEEHAQEEEEKQPQDDGMPEKILQIDDPKAVHINAEPAAAEERPPQVRPHPQVSEEQQEGEDKDPPKDKGQPDLPDQKENQL